MAFIAYSVLSDGKALPYQFGLATIKGFWEHLDIPRLRTNANQLENIYLMGKSMANNEANQLPMK